MKTIIFITLFCLIVSETPVVKSLISQKKPLMPALQQLNYAGSLKDTSVNSMIEPASPSQIVQVFGLLQKTPVSSVTGGDVAIKKSA